MVVLFLCRPLVIPGDVPVITYTITDGSLTNSADLFLTVEEITDLIEIDVVESCNQGFDTDGNYGIRYTVSFLEYQYPPEIITLRTLLETSTLCTIWMSFMVMVV